MKKLLILTAICLSIMIYSSNTIISANYWNADGDKFLLNHPWLKVKEFAISSDSKILNIKTQSDSLYQLDMETGEIFNKFLPSISKISRDWKFSEDGDYVIFADIDSWDVNLKKKKLDFKFYSQKITTNDHIDSLSYKIDGSHYFANSRGEGKYTQISYKYDQFYQLLFINFKENIDVLTGAPYPVYWSDGPCVRGFNVVFKIDSLYFDILNYFYMDGYMRLESYDRKNQKYFFSGQNAFAAIHDGIHDPSNPKYSYRYNYIYKYELDLNDFHLLKKNAFYDSTFTHLFATLNDNINFAIDIELSNVDSDVSSYNFPYYINIEKYIYNKLESSMKLATFIKAQFYPIDGDLVLIELDSNLLLLDLDKFQIIDKFVTNSKKNQSIKTANQLIITKNSENKIFKYKSKLINNKDFVEIYPIKSTFQKSDSIEFYFITNQNLKTFFWEYDGKKINTRNFNFVFNKEGKYNIKFYYSVDGINYQFISKEIQISQKIKADFTIEKKEYQINEKVNFVNKSIGNNLNFKWEFGDGFTSNEINPSHAYSIDQTYTVKLIAWDNLHKDSIVKYEYINCAFSNIEYSNYISFDDSLIVNFKKYKSLAKIFQQNIEISEVISNNDSSFYIQYREFRILKDTCTAFQGAMDFGENYYFSNLIKDEKQIYPYIKNKSDVYKIIPNKNHYVENSNSLFKLSNLISRYPFTNQSKDTINLAESMNLLMKLPYEYKYLTNINNEFILYNNKNNIQLYDSNSLKLTWDSKIITTDFLLYKNQLVKINENEIKKLDSIKILILNSKKANFKITTFSTKQFETIDTILFLNSYFYIFSRDYLKHYSIIFKLDLDANIISSRIVYNFENLRFAYPFYNYLIASGSRKNNDACILIDSNLQIKKYIALKDKFESNFFFTNDDKLYFAYKQNPKYKCLADDFFEFNKLTIDMSEFVSNFSQDTSQKEDTTVTTAINDFEKYSQTIIYPNPAQDQLYIQNISPGKMQIMDILGQVVMEFEIKEEEISKLLDISSLPSGVYLLQSGRTVQKFVKE